MAPVRVARRAFSLCATFALAAAACLPGVAGAQDLADDAPRGTLTFGYQGVHTRGSLDGGGNDTPFLANLETDIHSLTLGIDYRVAGRWSVHAALPFIRKRAVNDPGAHNANRLVEVHPDSPFLDDGSYHGNWQDWEVGVAYHASLGRFEVRPQLTLLIPSHDYPFFGSAATGQRLRSLLLGFDAERRIGRSNFHYGFGYSYEFVEPVLGTRPNRQHLRLNGRYDFSPDWSATVFVVGRKGHGLDPGIFPAEAAKGSALWYQHDRLLRHNYGLAGVSVAWRFAEAWTVSASTAGMAWGDSIHDIRGLYGLALARDF